MEDRRIKDRPSSGIQAKMQLEAYTSKLSGMLSLPWSPPFALQAKPGTISSA